MSTTVVNPGLWVSVYNDSPSAALFFIAFGVTTIFYLHSLVLSTVFQSYIETMKEMVARYENHKEECLLHAFRCLQQKSSMESESIGIVRTDLIRDVLVNLRPHYDKTKVGLMEFSFIDFRLIIFCVFSQIARLIDVIDPSEVGLVGYGKKSI